ncbi:MAG: prepilin-type N-terminal cleavage/methylation domain-containing protein [Sedimentisphaerales bacterium]|nr:prepilin-type N-terminal cleavage/methylation domain-containing protein [Sedimentisphaerales bacterium]
MRTCRKGFTLVEMLVVIAILMLLISILVPVVTRAKIAAGKARVRATIHSLEIAVEDFKGDQGIYPSSAPENPALDINLFTPSYDFQPNPAVDMGAHLLVRKLAGIDLLGYDPSGVYAINEANGAPMNREGEYIDTGKMEIWNFRVYTPEERITAFDKMDLSNPEVRTNRNPMVIGNSNISKPRPILYYKAAKNQNLIGTIYSAFDNSGITEDYVQPQNEHTQNRYYNNRQYMFHKHPDFRLNIHPNVRSTYVLPSPPDMPGTFESYIWNIDTSPDPRDIIARPYNKDSYLLIDAGPDGEYGTNDDICNFERK